MKSIRCAKSLRLVRMVGVAGVLALAFVPKDSNAEAAADYAAFVPALVQSVALPATDAMAARIDDLRGATAGACRPDATDAEREAFHAAFTSAVEAQARLGVLRFGALAEESRLERLAFVPDRRTVAWRQVTRLLADRPEDATDPDLLQGKSVALQGLTALEWAAYNGDGTVRLSAQAEDGYTCAYVAALGARLAALTQEIRDAYAQPTGQTALLQAPGSDNPIAADDKAAAGFAYLQLMTALSVITDQVLAPVLTEGPVQARAARAPFQRSRNARRHLSASIDGLANALRTAGYTTASEETAWIDNTLAFEAGNAQRVLSDVPDDFAVALADDSARGKLTYVSTVLTGLIPMFSLEIAGQLGFQGGFNALDGD